MPRLLPIIVTLAFAGCVHTASSSQSGSCEFNPSLQSEKSAVLQRLEREDQADRSGSIASIDWNKVAPRDLQRRIAVAEIFALGCFKTAEDYAAAAMIYQHGTTADHYYQAFIWSHQAVKLGDYSQRWMTAASIDRYLVKIGHKQLFGTQFFSEGNTGKYCIQPVESSFPDSRRVEYTNTSLKDGTTAFLKGVGAKQLQEEIEKCFPALNPTPQGTVPGFW